MKTSEWRETSGALRDWLKDHTNYRPTVPPPAALDRLKKLRRGPSEKPYQRKQTKP